MMFLTDTELVDNRVAVYWMGDEKEDKLVGVCFDGEGFNIARQSLAESMAFANDLLDDTLRIFLEKDVLEQLTLDAANLREYALSAEPAGVARLMVEVAEHLELVVKGPHDG